MFRTNKIALFGVIIAFLHSCVEQRKSFDLDINVFENLNAHIDSVNNQFGAHRALQVVDSLIELEPIQSDVADFLRYSIKTNLFHYTHLRNPKAIIYADSALLIIEPQKERYPIEYLNRLRLNAFTKMRYNQFDEAMNSIFTLKQFIESQGNPCDFISYHGDIANLLYAQQRYDEAIFFFKESKKSREFCLTDSLQLQKELLGIFNNMALAYTQINQIDSALVYYKAALIKDRFLQRISGKDLKYLRASNAVVLGNLGYCYFKKGDFKQAEELFKQSISENKDRTLNYVDALLTEMKLAELYIVQNRFTLAQKLIQSFESESEILDNLDYHTRLKRLKWLYEKALHPDKSLLYSYLEEFKLFEDSLKKAQLGVQKIDITSSLMVKQQSEFVSDLESKQKLSFYLLASLLLVLVLLSIIIWQIWHQSKQRKESLQRLEWVYAQLNHSYNKLELSVFQNHQLQRVVAHDMRNPLAGILGFVELIESDELSSEQRLYLRTIREACEDAIKLIEEILNNRNLSDSVLLNQLELSQIVEQSISLCQFQAKRKNQRIVFQSEPLAILGNREQLLRVFNNLISNALKFSDAHDVVEITCYRNENMAFVKIKDNGIGIPAEFMSFLFDKDDSKMRLGTQNEVSNGLGLLICKTILNEHGGQIYAESEVGKGSVFYVKLPIA